MQPRGLTSKAKTRRDSSSSNETRQWQARQSEVPWHVQARSQDFTLGEAQKPQRYTFFLKKVNNLFCRRPQNLSSPSSGVHIFEIFEAHRTQHFSLLIERTVLLYWIKQAIHPNKASFLPWKKSTQSTSGQVSLIRNYCFTKQWL